MTRPQNPVQRSQSHCNYDRRAIRISDNVAAFVTTGGALRRDKFKMFRVDLRNQQWHVRVHAVWRRIGNYRETSARKTLLRFTSDFSGKT